MRLCVFGAGAVGSFLAARLRSAGTDVSVVARGAHLEAIRERGLLLTEPSGETRVILPASDDPRDLGPQDAVIAAVKVHDLAAMAGMIGPLLRSDTPIVFAQNGIPWWYAHGFGAPGLPSGPIRRLDPKGILWDRIGPERAIGCVIYSPNAVAEPGHVVNNGRRPGRFPIGEPDGRVTPRCEAISAELERAGIGAPVSAGIRRFVWDKLILNVAGSASCVLTGTTVRGLLADPELRAVARGLMADALAVAESHGIRLDIDLDANTDPDRRPEHKSSMLQDFEAGRPMEVDPILTCVQDLGRAAGVPTPTLDCILPYVRVKARTAGLYLEGTSAP